MSTMKVTDGFEVGVSGPLVLGQTGRQRLTWLAKSGACMLGSVSLVSEIRHHVGTLRDLQLFTESMASRQSVSGKLLAAVAEYAREHGVLKVKVHRNSRMEWVPQQLSRHGLTDASTGRETMQFYVDLYRPIKKLHAASSGSKQQAKLAC